MGLLCSFLNYLTGTKVETNTVTDANIPGAGPTITPGVKIEFGTSDIYSNTLCIDLFLSTYQLLLLLGNRLTGLRSTGYAQFN